MAEALRYHREGDCLWVIPLTSHQDFCLSPELDELRAELDQGAIPRVIVDLSGLPAFGSTLLDLLVVIWRKIGRRDGRLVLYKPSPIGREVLSAARLDQLWSMAESREEAFELAHTADVA
jgi:anti-anti-sigma factor